jgi:hypothetical protein
VASKIKDYQLDALGYLRFRAGDVEGSVQAYTKLRATTAVISAMDGFTRSASLDFLVSNPQVDSIEFHLDPAGMTRLITRLPWLRRLSFASQDSAVDLSGHGKLEHLQLGWCKSTRLPPDDGALQELCLWRYKPSRKDLSELPKYRRLRDLSLFWGNLKAIDGIDSLPALTHLDLGYLRGLSKIALLARSSVTHVHLQAIKSIVDWPELVRCKQLRSLRMSKMGILPSIGFLRQMPRMEEFRFVETKVADGDLSPLLALKSVAFEDKRGYSHTEEEVLRGIAARRGKG